MRRFLTSTMIASVWVLGSGNAFAGDVHQYPECQKQATEIDILGAKGAFQAGNVSFNEADYDRAILYWEDAYRRDCTATLLLHHLSRAYEGQGNLEQAVVALKTYLDRTPDAAERTQSLRRIEVFEQRIEAERQRAARLAEEEKAKLAPPPKQTPPPPPPADSGKSNLYVSPMIPITVAVVGGVAAVVGSAIFLPAQHEVSDFRDKCPNYQCDYASDTEKGNSAQSRRNLGAVVAISGLVLTAGGVGWAIFNRSKKPTQSPVLATPAVQPWVLPQAAGLTYGGAF